MTERALSVHLRLAGPVLTRATAMGDYGVDAPVARAAVGDGDRGRPMLPGSLIKGKLRDAWRQLAEVAPGELAALGERGERIAEWLGEQNDRGGWEPRRGRLHFGDLVAAGEGGDGRRHRVQLDRELGAVRPGALQTIESPFAPGEEVEFTGEMRLVAPDDGELESLRAAVEAGLRWTPSFGALRGAGFGRLIAAEVAITSEAPARGATGTAAAVVAAPAATGEPAAARPGDEGGRWWLAYTIGAPFCLAREQPVDNLFVSRAEVPGAAIKGVVASTWNERLGRRAGEPIAEGCDPERPELARHFARVRFTHAFPTRRSDPLRRPVTPPLSLVWVGKGKDARLTDVARLGGPVLVPDGRGTMQAPVFAVDWKPDRRQAVRGLYGWASPAVELRVRTAIDAATRRAADARLFAHETVVPGGEEVWLGSVDLGDVPETERARAREQLAGLLALGLRGLGKTKAATTVEALGAGDVLPAVAGVPEPGGRGPWALVLQTPALLCDPGRLGAGADREAVAAAYGEVLGELSGGALELAEGGHFAAQRLAGGRYLWHRFFGADRPYRPLLLTEAGSVLLVRPAAGRADEAVAVVGRWERCGLPLPAWARARCSARPDEEDWALWDRCPYLRHNGYGELAVDPELPAGAPAAGAAEPIGWGTT